MFRPLLILLTLLASDVLAGDYEDGVIAYKNKDYAMALSKFQSAVQIFNPSFNQNNVYSAYNYLGLIYNHGRGVNKNYKKAASYFQAAALGGNSIAQYYLASLYFNGQGVQKDYILAYMWLNIAARSGDDVIIKERELVEKRLSQQQISEAQRMARECINSSYSKCNSFMPEKK
jgi:hypothetical protein